MPNLTFKTDSDMGLIEFFVDGVLLSSWVYEDDPELNFEEFKKVFMAGYEAGKSADK